MTPKAMPCGDVSHIEPQEAVVRTLPGCAGIYVKA